MKGYQDPDYKENFLGVSKAFVEMSHKNNIAVEENPEKAQHMIKNDLRDAIPPQLYALIAKIADVLESEALEGQNSHSRTGKNKV